jgi:hypothetical protein
MIYITDRLIIRKIEMSDLTDIIEYGTDIETAKYMIYWPKSEKEIESFIQSKMKPPRSKLRGILRTT